MTIKYLYIKEASKLTCHWISPWEGTHKWFPHIPVEILCILGCNRTNIPIRKQGCHNDDTLSKIALRIFNKELRSYDTRPVKNMWSDFVLRLCSPLKGGVQFEKHFLLFNQRFIIYTVFNFWLKGWLMCFIHTIA